MCCLYSDKKDNKVFNDGEFKKKKVNPEEGQSNGLGDHLWDSFLRAGRGDSTEWLTSGWLRRAGFDVSTRNPSGKVVSSSGEADYSWGETTARDPVTFSVSLIELSIKEACISLSLVKI